MKRYISITKDTRDFLKKVFGVTDKTIQNALVFDARRGESALSKRIRKLAMERGGEVMVEVSEMETWYDADGYMRQYFPNGVVLEGNKSTGKVELLIKGVAVRSYDNPLISEMAAIQRVAMSLK